MKELEISYKITVYENTGELDDQLKQLLEESMKAANTAYAPYSKFKVGCALRMSNGKIVIGGNQENASYPAGICAERVALSAASSLYPEVSVDQMAIAVVTSKQSHGDPVAPCGICRQTIFEYETRFNKDIPILLAGENGSLYLIKSVKDILPLGFSSKDFQ